MEHRIAVDLDGTLAHWSGWKGPENIGHPIPAMRDRVKQWLRSGKKVVILTARVSPLNEDPELSRKYVEQWLQKHFGAEIPVTHEKDPSMVELWDDRAKQVIKNTGKSLEEIMRETMDEIKRYTLAGMRSKENAVQICSKIYDLTQKAFTP